MIESNLEARLATVWGLMAMDIRIPGSLLPAPTQDLIQAAITSQNGVNHHAIEKNFYGYIQKIDEFILLRAERENINIYDEKPLPTNLPIFTGGGNRQWKPRVPMSSQIYTIG